MQTRTGTHLNAFYQSRAALIDTLHAGQIDKRYVFISIYMAWFYTCTTAKVAFGGWGKSILDCVYVWHFPHSIYRDIGLVLHKFKKKHLHFSCS